MIPSHHSQSFEEVVPASAMVKGLTRSSILTQRRRIRAPPQTGINYGSAGAGAGNRQLQFVIADAGGLLDPASINLVYNVQTSGTAGSTPVMDDGHPFVRCQINLNGQNLEDNAQCAKTTNAEVKLSTDQTWYKNEGSFCGFELLNNELNFAVPVATPTVAQQQAYSGAWADVLGNLPSIYARQTTTGAVFNPYGGEQRSMPLGLMSGVGRMKQYLPLNTLGELNITLFTGSKGECVFQTSGSTDGDFSLAGVYVEYDIVVPHPAYAELLHKMANDPSEPGLTMPFESTIMASSGTIGTSATLAESSVIVSRATQNLLRSFVILQPSTLASSPNYPIQSCFSHCGTYKIQWRIGSAYYPAIPAEGDASMWAMTMSAYGSAELNTGTTVVNRNLWSNYTYAVAPTMGAFEPVGASIRNAFADSFVPSFGFQIVKGRSEPLDVDGISLSGASGSQAVVVITLAPNTNGASITPTVALVALRFISAQGGAVRVIGA